MHQCPQCNELVSDDRPFCSKCGAAQLGSPAPFVCEACGRELPAPMRFCKWCGAVQTKYDGANDPAATTALSDQGRARQTAENLDAPDSLNTADDLNGASATRPVTRAPRPAMTSGATTDELDLASVNTVVISDTSEETLVRSRAASRAAYQSASQNAESVAAPQFTSTLTSAAPIPATKKRNVLALFSVAIIALALGAGLAFFVFQRSYRAPSRDSSGAVVPVIPIPMPTIGTRASTRSTTAPDVVTTAQAPQVIVAPAPSPSIAQPPNAGVPITNDQSAPGISGATTTGANVAAAARLPDGAPRSGTGEWRGIVIGSAIIEFSGRNQSVVGSTPSLRSARLSIDNGLPKAPAIVRIDKKKGQGQIGVVQQPSAANNYAARVQLINAKSTAAEEYVFDLTWDAAAP
jgi:RNA polymerase subunit RPABC4/transcription elongation factor Spt4